MAWRAGEERATGDRLQSLCRQREDFISSAFNTIVICDLSTPLCRFILATNTERTRRLLYHFPDGKTKDQAIGDLPYFTEFMKGRMELRPKGAA